MPLGACRLLCPELHAEVKWLSPCTSGRYQLPLWPPRGQLGRMSSQGWKPCDHDTLLLPARLDQRRAQLSSEGCSPAPGQDPGFSRGQLQGLSSGDARWQGKQPLSYHEGVLRQLEAWWCQESTCVTGRGLGSGIQGRGGGLGARWAFLRAGVGGWGKDRLPGKSPGAFRSRETQTVISGASGPGDTVLPLTATGIQGQG